MKTKELISLLNKCDPEGEVLVELEAENGRHVQIIETVMESKTNGKAFVCSYYDD